MHPRRTPGPSLFASTDGSSELCYRSTCRMSTILPESRQSSVTCSTSCILILLRSLLHKLDWYNPNIVLFVQMLRQRSLKLRASSNTLPTDAEDLQVLMILTGALGRYLGSPILISRSYVRMHSPQNFPWPSPLVAGALAGVLWVSLVHAGSDSDIPFASPCLSLSLHGGQKPNANMAAHLRHLCREFQCFHVNLFLLSMSAIFENFLTMLILPRKIEFYRALGVRISASTRWL